MPYDTGSDQYRLARMHRRLGAPSTKVGNKTYARIERVEAQNGVPTFEVKITYFTTDIITCLYTVRTPSWIGTQRNPYDEDQVLYLMEQVIQPMAVQITNGGYCTPSTTRRINAFLTNNDIRLSFYTVSGALFMREHAPNGTVVEQAWCADDEAFVLLDDSNSNRSLHKYEQVNRPDSPFELNNPIGYNPGWTNSR